jgi:transmembrane sensor
MNTISENQFYDLLSLKLSGDAGKNELELLQQQLEVNPQWQFLYDQMMHVGVVYPREHIEQSYAAHIVKMQLQGKLQNLPVAEHINGSKNLFRRFFSAIAAAACIIGFSFFVYMKINEKEKVRNSLNEVATKRGSKSFIKLPDGSQVWLNADSKLTFKENFGDKNREVSLTGEAFFDVFHDAEHPFIIHTGKADVKVLGTTFNIRNYDADRTMEASLIKGKIEVTLTDRPDEKIIIHSQEKIIIAKQSNKSGELKPSKTGINRVILTTVTLKDTLVVETGWMKDKLVFVNQPLEKIAEEIERKFAVTIVFKTEAIKQYRYTGIFEKESVNEMFKIIQLSRNIHYNINNKTITID